MIFAFDVGNTETTIALFDGDEIRAHWRITTNSPRTADELALVLDSLLKTQGLLPSSIEGSAICSVVPPMTEILASACRDCFGREALMVDARADLPVKLEVDEPFSVGADRVANALAAMNICKRDTIVVDLGTATTYDCITKDGAFIGGIIQPGVRSSANTLFTRTALLSATELRAPKRVIGTRTDECIRSGVLYGAADSIDGLVRRIVDEWGVGTPMVVGTGGLASALQPFCKSFDLVDSWFTLKGVRIGYELLTRTA
jgi:type III pantothenate kinase